MHQKSRPYYRMTILASLLAASTFCGGCALGIVPLSAASIDGQVMDANTEAPVSGAVVVAYWELRPGSFAGDSLPCGAANVDEAVTDASGNFHIPSWGPRIASCGYMDDNNPIIYVFRSGYAYFKSGLGPGSGHAISRTFSRLPLQITLTRFSDVDPSLREKKESDDVSELDNELGNFVLNLPYQCNWKTIPNMLRALAKRAVAIQTSDGLISSLVVNDESLKQENPQCGSPKDFIASLSKLGK